MRKNTARRSIIVLGTECKGTVARQGHINLKIIRVNWAFPSRLWDELSPMFCKGICWNRRECATSVPLSVTKPQQQLATSVNCWIGNECVFLKTRQHYTPAENEFHKCMHSLSRGQIERGNIIEVVFDHVIKFLRPNFENPTSLILFNLASEKTINYQWVLVYSNWSSDSNVNSNSNI